MNHNQAFNYIIIILIILYYVGQYNNKTIINDTIKRDVESYNQNIERYRIKYNQLVEKYNQEMERNRINYNELVEKYNYNIELYNNPKQYSNNYRVDYTYTNRDIARLKAHGLRL